MEKHRKFTRENFRENIFELLKKEGKITPIDLAKKMGITTLAAQRELFAMELDTNIIKSIIVFETGNWSRRVWIKNPDFKGGENE